jgi:UDP-N-acetylglucosamine acyltransferase
MIHQTAIISSNAKIGKNVEIGAYSIIGDNVEIGDNSVIKSHVVIEGNTKIGKNNVIFPFASIGQVPQDLKFGGENSSVEIGDNNTIREHVTIHAGTKTGRMITSVGNNCLLMVGVHIAHDCIIKNNIILANNVILAGHVEVENYAVIGGLSAVHQFVRIGQYAMIGGMSGVESDVIPYATVMGERANLAGLNLVGMKRHNIDRSDINALRHFIKEIFNKNQSSFSERVKKLAAESNSSRVKEILQFVEVGSSRSFCKPKED